MRVVHFELSCVAVSGEPSIPLFCMFYKLISDGDWFTFAKRKDSISQPCYSFIPNSTYPKEWKSRFIFVSAAMMPESPPLRDAKAAIEDNIPVLSTNEIVLWKRMYENPTRAFTFPEGIFAMGGISPSYPIRPKAFVGKKEMTLWGLLQGDCKDVQFVVGDKVESGLNRGAEKKVTKGSVQARESAAEERDKGASSGEKKGPLGSLQVRRSSDDDNDEDLEIRLVRKRKAASPNSPKKIPNVPSSSRTRDKTPEVSAARVTPTFEISPLHATGTSKPSHLGDFASRPPLAPLFNDALLVPYVPKWKITQSTVVS
ncbi:hypothetical protein Hanom_Chr10g00888191 [Helianthus anomalus]